MPPVTQTLIAANVLVYLLGGMSGMPLGAWFALWSPSHPMLSLFQPWQLVTYSFLHADFMHLFFNMYGLYLFGSSVERLFGARFYTLYYFAAVVSAAVCHLVIVNLLIGEAGSMVGASGGLFGVMLAFGLYFPHQRMQLLFPPIVLNARTLVIGYAALEIFFAVTGTDAGVAHFAHLGGMLGGWLMIEYRKRGGGRQ